eukprot:4713788-Prymnesium_polylepis.1
MRHTHEQTVLQGIAQGFTAILRHTAVSRAGLATRSTELARSRNTQRSAAASASPSSPATLPVAAA